MLVGNKQGQCIMLHYCFQFNVGESDNMYCLSVKNAAANNVVCF